MIYPSSEQATHDKVNLYRLVRRLEKTVADESWNAESSPKATWIKTQGILQKLKYARKLLTSVELYEADLDAYQKYESYRQTICRLETTVKEIDQRVAPKPRRPGPILPTLPLPVFPSVSPAPPPSAPSNATGETITPSVEEDPTAIAANDLLLSPSDTETVLRYSSTNPSNTLLSPSLSSSSTVKTTSAPAFLQNSAALQEELSAQLAQMATQLKRNAVHFADSLEKDKALVLETQEKLERNHDVMKRERLRVRDHRSKSWGTTWLVMLSIVIALVGFILTFFVIRITR